MKLPFKFAVERCLIGYAKRLIAAFQSPWIPEAYASITVRTGRQKGDKVKRGMLKMHFSVVSISLQLRVIIGPMLKEHGSQNLWSPL